MRSQRTGRVAPSRHAVTTAAAASAVAATAAAAPHNYQSVGSTEWCKQDNELTHEIRTKLGRTDGFKSCAMVGASGLLLRTRLARQIDEHELIIRTNLAPVGGYEPIVGSRTDVRVMSTESLKTVLIERACPELVANRSSFCPAYGVFANSKSAGTLGRALHLGCGDRTPMFDGNDFKSDPVISHFSRPGFHVMTGAWGIALAMHACPSGVDVYGYTHEGTINMSRGVPFHYYDTAGLSQLDAPMSATSRDLSLLAEQQPRCLRLHVPDRLETKYQPSTSRVISDPFVDGIAHKGPYKRHIVPDLTSPVRSCSSLPPSPTSSSVRQWLCGEPNVPRPQALTAALLPFYRREWADVLYDVLSTSCGFKGRLADGERRSSAAHFALLKTHKTASSTLEVMLARDAQQHGLRSAGCQFDRGSHFFQSGGCDLSHALGGARFDYVMRHNFRKDQWWSNRPAAAHAGTGRGGCDHADGRWFDQLQASYQQIFAIGHPPLIIPVRDPESHLRSALSYYHISAAKYIATPGLWNPLAKDFRLINESHVRRFIAKWPEDAARQQRMHPIVLERFFESLVTMRRLLNWSLSDVVHTRVTHTGDAAEVGTTPPAAVAVAAIPNRTLALDRRLYESFASLLARQMGQLASPSFRIEVVALQRISEALRAVCRWWQPKTKRRGNATEWMMRLATWCEYSQATEENVEQWACSPHVVQ